MKKILLSLLTVALVSAAAVGATRAYFSDTETSEGNTFVAGALDLKVDSECYYYSGQENENPLDHDTWYAPNYCNFSETDLDSGNDIRFFDFHDLKPGDMGEMTLSLHVYDNDALVDVAISQTEDLDNDITEPEDWEYDGLDQNDGTPDGDLNDNLWVHIWKDQGIVPGWQNSDPNPDNDDPEEGDNVWQGEEAEPTLVKGYASEIGAGVNWDIGQLTASTTYYIGVKWSLDYDTVGNIAQTDSYVADLVFTAVQARHNPEGPGVPF